MDFLSVATLVSVKLLSPLATKVTTPYLWGPFISPKGGRPIIPPETCNGKFSNKRKSQTGITSQEVLKDQLQADDRPAVSGGDNGPYPLKSPYTIDRGLIDIQLPDTLDNAR
jgi:hypothetical protein